VAAGLIFAFIAGVYLGGGWSLTSPSAAAPYVPTTRHFALYIEGANISEGPTAVWHAWTYNGTVPGPTLHAWVGDTIVVKVYNHLNLIVSFHTHLVNYNFTNDASQGNVQQDQQGPLVRTEHRVKDDEDHENGQGNDQR
jgi:FtsP/CotA-like multicopper oxidase with cupredoxin domain